MSSVQHAADRPSRFLRRAAIAGMLILGFAAAGCGGSGGAQSSSTAAAVTMTKVEFLAKANAICAKADPALSEAGARIAALRNVKQVAAVVSAVYVPAIESQIAQIRLLGAPGGEAAAVADMLKLVQGDLARLRSHPALVTTDVFANFAKLAHPYGLTSCAPLS